MADIPINEDWTLDGGLVPRANLVRLKETSRSISMNSIENTAAFLRSFEDDSFYSISVMKLLLVFDANPNNASLPSHLNDDYCCDQDDDSDTRESEFNAKTVLEQFLESAKKAYNKSHQNDDVQNSNATEDKNMVVALALDGGKGCVGGMITSLILRFVAKRVFNDETIIQRRINWIGGASTGAIIGLALITAEPNRKTPLDCFDFFWRLFKANIYVERSGNETLNNMVSGGLLTRLKPFLGWDENDLSTCQSNFERRIPKFCTAVQNITHPRTEVLRNYVGHDETLIPTLHFWQVAAMSNAAPPYFPPFDHHDEIYFGDDEVTDSSVQCLLEEISSDDLKRIGAFLSIGTGQLAENSETLEKEEEALESARTVFDEIRIPSAAFNRLSPGKIIRNEYNTSELVQHDYWANPPELESDTGNLARVINCLWDLAVYLAQDTTLAIIDRFRADYEASQMVNHDPVVH